MRQSARAVIPTIISQLLSEKNEVELGSLSPTRDFTYVKDTVNGFVAALNTKEVLGGVINLGTNFEISIEKLAQEIANLMKKNIIIKNNNLRFRPKKSEVDRLKSDNKKAKQLLKWSPLFNDIEGLRKGLTETISWFSKRDNLKLYKTNLYNF